MSDSRRDFFPKHRRKLELDDWKPLRNAQGEKRIRLDFLMPLTGQQIVAMPAFVSSVYERVDVENSPVKDVDLMTELEGMTLEAYETESSKPMEYQWGLGLDEAKAAEAERRRKLLLTNCELRNFKLVRITRDKQAIVALSFSCTTRSDSFLAVWAERYNGATFWAEFTASELETRERQGQGKLGLESAPADPIEQQKDAADLARELNPDDQPPCPYPACKLKQDHPGDHDLKPKAQMTKAEKEAVAKAKGVPAGFVQ